jgi:hypothetical protein
LDESQLSRYVPPEMRRRRRRWRSPFDSAIHNEKNLFEVVIQFFL